jgi:hypothetical protein
MRKEYADMTLYELAYERGVLTGYITLAVAQARRGGSTWQAIGSSLGVSMQEAHRKYSYLDRVIAGESLPTAD